MVAVKKELMINRVLMGFNILALIIIAVATFAREDRQVNQEEIDSKPSYDYVNGKDEEIQKNIDDYKVDHQIQHDGTQALLKSMDSKIDILLTEK